MAARADAASVLSAILITQTLTLNHVQVETYAFPTGKTPVLDVNKIEISARSQQCFEVAKQRILFLAEDVQLLQCRRNLFFYRGRLLPTQSLPG